MRLSESLTPVEILAVTTFVDDAMAASEGGKLAILVDIQIIWPNPRSQEHCRVLYSAIADIVLRGLKIVKEEQSMN